MVIREMPSQRAALAWLPCARSMARAKSSRYDPNWNVRIDGNSARLLHCNYLMRGVYLEPGKHLVEFRFQPPFKLLYVSLAALVLGAVLFGVVIVTRRHETSRIDHAPLRNASQSSPIKSREKRPRQIETKFGR